MNNTQNTIEKTFWKKEQKLTIPERNGHKCPRLICRIAMLTKRWTAGASQLSWRPAELRPSWTKPFCKRSVIRQCVCAVYCARCSLIWYSTLPCNTPFTEWLVQLGRGWQFVNPIGWYLRFRAWWPKNKALNISGSHKLAIEPTVSLRDLVLVFVLFLQHIFSIVFLSVIH